MAEKAKQKKEEDEEKARVEKEKELLRLEEEALKRRASPREQAMQEIKLNLALLTRAVKAKDKTLFNRVLRHNNRIRRKLNGSILVDVVKEYYPEAQQYLDYIQPTIEADIASDAKAELEFKTAEDERLAAEQAKKAARELAEQTRKEEAAAKAAKVAASRAALFGKRAQQEEEMAKAAQLKKASAELKASKAKAEADKKEKERAEAEAKVKEHVEASPETHTYVHLLLVMFMLDKKLAQEAARASTELFTFVQSQNRRTLDILSAKVYLYHSLCFERLGQLVDIREPLLLAHRTACLQHNEPGQAVLTTVILRNYLHYNHYSQADKFRLNTTLPESRSNNIHARYLYYLGKISAIQLHYSDAYGYLTQALRKAPQNSALGFREQANKLLVCVQLLMGDIPDRQIFHQLKALGPYFRLAQCVRSGDLRVFTQVNETFKAKFIADGVYSLIVRLRHNVIKAGLRRLNLAYSKISLADICAKLNLESEEDAEHIVTKAIHDGVIDAVVDRQKRYMFSKETGDVYATAEPQTMFDKRIRFCMDVHNEAVRAMRFPPNSYKVDKAEPAKEEEEVVPEDSEGEDTIDGL